MSGYKSSTPHFPSKVRGKAQGSKQKEKSRDSAVALKYTPPKDKAPRVVAKGKGEIARRIIELAKRHGIPLKEDPDLVEILSTLDLFEEIPPEIYRAVAEILAFIYSINRSFPYPPG